MSIAKTSPEGKDCGLPSIDAESLNACSRFKLADSIDRLSESLKTVDMLRREARALIKIATLAAARINEIESAKEGGK